MKAKGEKPGRDHTTCGGGGRVATKWTKPWFASVGTSGCLAEQVGLPSELLEGLPDPECSAEVAATQATAAAAAEGAWRAAGHADAPVGWACNIRASVVNHFGVRRVAFFALRDIFKGEEMCYDYGDEFKKYCGFDMI